MNKKIIIIGIIVIALIIIINIGYNYLINSGYIEYMDGDETSEGEESDPLTKLMDKEVYLKYTIPKDDKNPKPIILYLTIAPKKDCENIIIATADALYKDLPDGVKYECSKNVAILQKEKDKNSKLKLIKLGIGTPQKYALYATTEEKKPNRALTQKLGFTNIPTRESIPTPLCFDSIKGKSTDFELEKNKDGYKIFFKKRIVVNKEVKYVKYYVGIDVMTCKKGDERHKRLCLYKEDMDKRKMNKVISFEIELV